MTQHDNELNPVGETPYHGFREWGYKDPFDIADEFQAVDGELPKSGTLADRPLDPPEGSYYRAEDVRIAFRYDPTNSLADGDGWVAVAGLGTSANPVPGTSHFEETSAELASVGISPNRPLISNADRTISVPGDYSTIQEAVDAVPLFMRHRWIIEIANGTYNEDVVIGGVTNTSTMDGDDSYSTNGNHGTLSIVGNPSNPADVTVSSLTILSCTGATNPDIRGIRFDGQNPHVDETGTLHIAGTQEAQIMDCNFIANLSTSGAGVTAYASGAKVDNCDFGTENYQRGIVVKRGGFLTSVRNDGQFTDFIYGLTQGGVINHRLDTMTAPEVAPVGGGFVINNDTGEIHRKTSTGATAYLSADQTLTSGSSAQIAFDATEYDHRNEFNTSASEYQINNPGVYGVNVAARVDTPHDINQFIVQIRVNGSVRAANGTAVVDGAYDVTGTASRHLELGAGDTVSGHVYQTSANGADQTLSGHTNHTFMSVDQLG